MRTAETWQRGAISPGVRIQIRGSKEGGLRLDMTNLRSETGNSSEILSKKDKCGRYLLV